MSKVLIIMSGVILGFAIVFPIIAGLSFGIAWCFDYDLTWKMAFGIYLALLAVQLFIKGLQAKWD